MHKYGIENPRSGLADKVIGFQFSEKVEVMDPYTKKRDKKPLKPFMVNTSVNIFEKHGIILNPKDKAFQTQLEDYRVKSISSTGLPIFSDENEHAIDAMNLCFLIFEQKHNALLKKIYTNRISFIGNIDNRNVGVKERAIKDSQYVEEFISPKVIKSRVDGEPSIIYPMGRNNRSESRSKRQNMFTRKKF